MIPFANARNSIGYPILSEYFYKNINSRIAYFILKVGMSWHKMASNHITSV